MKALFFLPTLLTFLFFGNKPTPSDIFLQGKISDKNGEALIGASVLFFNTNTHLAATTDVDGKYKVKLIPATYSVSVAYVGYHKKEVKDVVVKAATENTLDFVLEENSEVLEYVMVKAYKIPIIHPDVLTTGSTTSGRTVTSEHIANLPTRNTSAMVSPMPGVSSNDGDGKVRIKGSRDGNTVYMVDGIRTNKESLSETAVSKKSIKSKKELKKERVAKESLPIIVAEEKLIKEKKVIDIERTLSYKPLIESALDIQPGRITASENSDFKHWAFWKDEKKNTELSENKKYWKWNVEGRISVLLVNKLGFPLANLPVHLENESGKTIWKTVTDNLGRAELWSNMFGEKTEKVKIAVENNGEKKYISPNKNEAKATTIVLDAPCVTSLKADVMFVVDATSSMDDEIKYLQMDMQNVIERVKKTNSAAALRLSSVFYRDNGDEYLTRESDFSEDVSRNLDFIKAQNAGGGGYDNPEEVRSALEKALSMNWDESSTTKILFLFLDAPPHYNDETLDKMKTLTQRFATKGIKIIPVSASGIQKDTEYLMRFMALATNGTYTYLTNDSGIGNDHIEATVSDVSVEFLNNLLVRLINQSMVLPTCEKSNEQALQYIDNQQYNQNNQGLKLEAKLYPTIANNEINIELSNATDEAYIYSNEGRLLKKLGKFDKGKHRIELDGIISGMYFLQIVKQGVSFGQKFIVVNDLK